MTDPGSLLLLVLGLGALVLKLWALADSVTRPAAAFPAAGKLTKPAWVAILAVALLLTLLSGASFMGLLSIVGTIAAIVYLVDVRPAVRELNQGGRWG